MSELPFGPGAGLPARFEGSTLWDPYLNLRPEAVQLGAGLVDLLRILSGPNNKRRKETVGTLEGLEDIWDIIQGWLTKLKFGFPRIEREAGVSLSAHTIKLNLPEGETAPLVIVPAGWNPVGWPLFEWSYLLLALGRNLGLLGGTGYHVLAYTPRGLGIPGVLSTSTGTIDVGGPRDREDGWAVIDYAVDFFGSSLATNDAGEPIIGFLGESYGSGISQMVAATDPQDRVKAVVALSTWGNLATSLYDNGTRHVAAVNALLSLTGGNVEDKFDGPTMQMLEDFLANRNIEAVVEWGQNRSPETFIAETNQRKIATFYSNTWHEGLFPANEAINTFNQLAADVPRHLNMWIGDHTAPEGDLLVNPFAYLGSIGNILKPLLPDLPDLPPGKYTPPLTDALDWLDYHLKGAVTLPPVPQWKKIRAQVMFTYTTRPVVGDDGLETGENEITAPALIDALDDWSTFADRTEHLQLIRTVGHDRDGELAKEISRGWEQSFIAGLYTAATAMDGIIATGNLEWSGNPKIYDTRKIDRDYAAVWVSEPLASLTPGLQPNIGWKIRGKPHVHLRVRSTAASSAARSATLAAYLLDVAEDDTARIITHEPITVARLGQDEERLADWDLQAAAYNVPTGHRLMLVIDSKDALYGDETVAWTRTTIVSRDDDPAHLTVPIFSKVSRT